ncbi:MAG: DegV family protein [Solirubrobacterales bacterium]|nr:DegV family protein [Solirubrobacterales bacterium]
MPADPAIALVTDSTASLSDEDRERLDVAVVSLYVVLDGEQQREDTIEDYPAFYQAVLDSPRQTTTSQPSVGDFTDIYLPLLEEGREIISVHLSSGISGTCEAARQAATALTEGGRGGERIHVVDSRTTSGGLAFCVLAAANGIRAGESVGEIIERIERTRDGIDTLLMVDTLDYLRKGGRIGSAQAMIGGALKIKPLIKLEETVKPVDKVRTSARAMEKMREYARKKAAGGEEITWTVQHIQRPEVAADLAAWCREAFQCEGAFLDEMTVVLGVHSGPGTVAIGTVPTELVGSKF